MYRSNGNRGVVCAALLGITVSTLWSVGCATIYYSVWETLGWEKRDLLRDSVEEVREDQQEVSEQFSSALEQIKAIYGLRGGDLERQYESLKSVYERSDTKATELRDRIGRAEDIAADLFAEWEREAGEISDPSLRSRSRQQLAATQDRFARLRSAMRQSESSMEPVLRKLKDQVLFLKHNLNAQAIGSIAVEVETIEREVDRLIADLRQSISRADEFISDLPR